MHPSMFNGLDRAVASGLTAVLWGATVLLAVLACYLCGWDAPKRHPAETALALAGLWVTLSWCVRGLLGD